jgi:hypothetical protein
MHIKKPPEGGSHAIPGITVSCTLEAGHFIVKFIPRWADTFLVLGIYLPSLKL